MELVEVMLNINKLLLTTPPFLHTFVKKYLNEVYMEISDPPPIHARVPEMASFEINTDQSALSQTVDLH